MNYYLLLLRNEKIDFSKFTQTEMEAILYDFDIWNNRMISEGRLLVSASLQGGNGKTIKGSTVFDGLYNEAKEAVAGLLLIAAEDLKQAQEMASGCPFLARGGSVEVRYVPRLEFEDAALVIAEEHSSARKKQ